jgi:hypothetical protein
MLVQFQWRGSAQGGRGKGGQGKMSRTRRRGRDKLLQTRLHGEHLGLAGPVKSPKQQVK